MALNEFELGHYDFGEYLEANTDSEVTYQDSIMIKMTPCPICGADDIFEVNRDDGRWCCYAEGHDHGGGLTDYLMEYQGLNKEEAEDILHKYLGIDFKPKDIIVQDNIVGFPKSENISEHGKEVELKTLVQKYHSDVNNTPYYDDLGISDDLINKYQLGYDKDNNALTIPCFENGNLMIIKKMSLNTSMQISQVGNREYYFNRDLLDSKQSLIFVTDRISDALSVELVTGEPAIAINGKEGIESFVRKIEALEKNKHFIFLLEKIRLDKKNQVAIDNNNSFSTHNLIKYTTTNEYLKNGEQSYLKEELRSVRDKILNKDFNVSFLDKLRDNILTEETKFVPTGFDNLDQVLKGGLLPGIYVLGAISSLGKTTFTLQIADQIASKGRDVIFFSLEQSREELMCKSISRIAYNIDKNSTLNTFDMLSNNLDLNQNKQFDKALEEYRHTSKHLAIIRKARSIEDIRKKVVEKVGLRGSKPVVVVDFLQRLEFPKANMSYREAIDLNLSKLKELSDDYNLSILVISSFNRDNYNNEVRLQSFKESGGIEYTADVVIGLQLTKIHEHDNFKYNDIEKWKTENPRKIQAVVLKYRNGPVGKRANFKYYPEHNTIKEI